MELIPVFLLFVLGLVFIIKGGDFFVDAASWIAEISGLPSFVIGATVVSIATTLPELLVSLVSALNGQTGMAVGNVVGSVTANTALILALSFVFSPCPVKRSEFTLKSVLMLSATVLLFVLSLSGELKVLPAMLLFVVLAVFVWENISSAKKEKGGAPQEKRRVSGKKEIAVNLLKFVLGAAGIILGAELLVDNGTIIAEKMNVPETIVGVVMLGLGTSLPELVTAITALAKKQGSLSRGNIIGANIIDMTLLLPLCSAVSMGSLAVSRQALVLDFPVCIAAIFVAVVPTLIFGKTQRWQGIALIAFYLVYLITLAIFFI